MDSTNSYRLPGYTIDDLADDLGDTVHQALAPIIRALANDHTNRWVEHHKDTYRMEIEAVRKECEQRLRDQEARHRENITAWERAQVARFAGMPGAHAPAVDIAGAPVTLPHSGQVPAVLHDVPGPLFRIRWQQGQPAGEGEPWSVPEGWVLDDDQAGTWLDRINTRHCTGL